MNIEDDLTTAMRDAAADSPNSADIRRYVNRRVRDRHKARRAFLASCATVTAVAAIATTATFFHGPTATEQRAGSPGAAVTGPSSQVSRQTPDQIGQSGRPGAIVNTTDNVPTPLFSMRCYATADVGRADNHLAVSVAGLPNTADRSAAAIDACHNKWATGVLSQSKPYVVDHPTASSAMTPANLTTCLLGTELSDTGASEVGVFPGLSTTCQHLGLSKYPG